VRAVRAPRKVCPVRLASGRSRCGPSPKSIGPSRYPPYTFYRPLLFGVFAKSTSERTAISDSILVAPFSNFEFRISNQEIVALRHVLALRHCIGAPSAKTFHSIAKTLNRSSKSGIALYYQLLQYYCVSLSSSPSLRPLHKSLNHPHECEGIRMAQAPRCWMTRPLVP